MKNSRSLEISDFYFLKYITEKTWQMGEKSSRKKFERAAPEELR